MTDKKLSNPTVADVIAYLGTFLPESPFRIEDPDTNWIINIIYAHQDSMGIVFFTGDYGDMNSDPEDNKETSTA